MSTYVIVGGVAGGASAAARLRRRDEKATIVMLERGPFVSFANCGLPYHIGGTIAKRESLLVSTPEKLMSEFSIDVRVENEVTGIDRTAKTVAVRNLKTGETYDLAYDKLVLSPGAKPLIPPLPGVDAPGVFSLRTIPDMDLIKAHLDMASVREAIVVGGGFIGLEMAENLVDRGITVTLVEMMPQVMTALDFELAAPIHRHLRDKGIRLGLGDGLKSIERTGADRLRVTLQSGKSAETDMVILALGVRPENDLALAAGLEVGPRGHIVVSDAMQTSDPDIYAVGDAIQVTHPVTGTPTAIPLAGPANRQARIAADQITGGDATYRGTMGTSVVKVFDMTAAVTGANSATLDRAGIEYLTSNTHTADHVSYYPGATTQSIKILYTPEGKLLGAQAVGQNAIDRTIDVIATAITAGMTVFDLEHLELAYAPPYGAAKDPVNIAGYVAANRLRGDADLITWDKIADLDTNEYGVLDVRTDPEWLLGHIPGAVHIENTALRGRLDELDKNKTWVITCAIGQRAYVMQRMMLQRGFKALNLTGGWTTYSVATETQSNFDTWCRPSGADCAEGSCESDTNCSASYHIDASLDACGLQCPGPIMAVYKKMQEVEQGQVLEVTASDPGFGRDVAAWSERTGNRLLEVREERGTVRALLQKGSAPAQITVSANGTLPTAKTMVVFSGDLDKALASFVIANGAAAMGQQVTMFFTFWGLNILRRRNSVPVKKNLVERMFGWMMPKGADALTLSKLNMGGAGTAMIKAVMKSKHIDSLPALMASAQEAGVRMIACQMSMDMMGIHKEELIDGVDVGGVATFINETDKANASLFI